MKSWCGAAVNVSLVEDEPDKLIASAELVIIASEAKWVADSANKMVNIHQLCEFRLMVSAKGMREFCKVLETYADDMEKLEARASIKPDLKE